MRYRVYCRARHPRDESFWLGTEYTSREDALAGIQNIYDAPGPIDHAFVLVADGDLHDELDEIWEEWWKLSG